MFRPIHYQLLLAIICGLTAAVFLSPANAADNPAGASGGRLWLDRFVYACGEMITVHFTASAAYPANAWVGIVASGVTHGSEMVNDQYDLAFQHLQRQTAGDLTFTAPAIPGAYDFRMHDTDDGTSGREVASVSFAVNEHGTYAADGSGGTSNAPGVRLWLDRATVAPHEQIIVHFTASANYPADAWVGLVDASVEHGSEAVNDQHDLAYQTMQQQTAGDLLFTAPDLPGSYDFRMHDSDNGAVGREVAAVPFTVVQSAGAGNASSSADGRLWLDRFVFAYGETITVHFTASAEYPADAWVGFMASSVAHGSEAVNDQYDLAYQYLQRQTAGDLTFTAPAIPGAYDFRMHDSDDGTRGREVASVSFAVNEHGTYAADGSGGTSNAPGVRLWVDRAIVAPQERITVHFTASANYPADAWVGIVASSVEHGSEKINDDHDLEYQYLQRQASGTLTFTSPDLPGTYDFRMNDSDDAACGREVATVSFTVREENSATDGASGGAATGEYAPAAEGR